MSGKRELIIVEDDLEQANYLINLISKKTYDIKILSDGKKAYEYLLHSAPNHCIVVLDYYLPGMSGLEILEKLNESSKNHACIIFTANEDLNVIFKAYQIGAYDYLIKSQLTNTIFPVILEKAYQKLQLEIERNNAIDNLRKSESLYKSLTESSSDYIVRFDINLKYQYLNNAAKNISQSFNNELIGKTNKEIGLSDNIYNHWDEKIKNVIEHKKPIQFKFEWDNKIKGKIFLDIKLCPEFDEDNNLISVLGFARDITEQKKIEETQIFLAKSNWILENVDFFQGLAKFLYDTLDMDYVCIDELLNNNLEAKTLAVYHNGIFEDNVTYTLYETPCADVVKNQICFIPNKVRHLFPKDAILQDMSAESYAGITLFDSQRKPIGLIALVSKKPKENNYIIESVLNLVGLRAANELESVIAKKSLQKSELKYKILVEQASDGIFIHDEKGCFLEVNQSCCDILGYSKKELLNLTLMDLILKEELEKLPIKWKELRNGLNARTERTIIKKDRTHAIVEISGKMIDNNTYQAFVRDISERKRMEQIIEHKLNALTSPNIENNELKFEDLFDINEIQKIQDAFSKATGVASIITDVNGIPLTKPSNFCYLCQDIIRKTEKGLKNCQYSDAVLGKFNSHGPNIQKCLSGGLWDCGAGIKAGELPVANWLIGQVLDETASVESMLNYCSEIGADENEFKKALQNVKRMPKQQFEEICQTLYLVAEQYSKFAMQNLLQARFINESKVASETLRKSENKFRSIWENSTDGMRILDENGITTMVNKAFCKMFEIKESEIIGFPLSKIYENIEGKDIFQSFLEKIKNNNIVDIVDNEFTLWNGKKKWLQVSHTLISNENEERIILSIFRDITERKYNEELLKNISIAETSAKIKQQFLANMSHEMRTPMNGIIGMANFLDNTDLNDSQKEFVSIIKESSKTLLQLINDVLELSKIESGKIILHKDEIYTEELVKKIKNLFVPFAVRKNISLTINVEKKFPTSFISDEKRLMQIITNLTTNAIKFTEKGKIKIDFKIKNNLLDKYLIEVIVKDTGIGIDQNYLKNIFEKFTQIDESKTRTNEGSGLGLAISKELVKLLNGELTVESVIGKGSTFIFTILVEKNYNKPSESITKIENQKFDLNLSVLLVEDKFVNRKVAELMLKNLKCTVDIAENGAIAIDKIKQNQYDIVLMDIQMPVMDGATAVCELRKMKIKLPIIIGLSAEAMEGDAEKYIALGMDDYMTKPLLPEILYEKLLTWKLK